MLVNTVRDRDALVKILVARFNGQQDAQKKLLEDLLAERGAREKKESELVSNINLLYHQSFVIRIKILIIRVTHRAEIFYSKGNFV